MKIYLVTTGDHDDYRVRGAFSSRQAAETYMNQGALDELFIAHPTATAIAIQGWHRLGDKSDLNAIEEFELDSLPPIEWRFGTYEDLYKEPPQSSSEQADEFIGRVETFKDEEESE